jgi:hypothetical protein
VSFSDDFGGMNYCAPFAWPPKHLGKSGQLLVASAPLSRTSKSYQSGGNSVNGICN